VGAVTGVLTPQKDFFDKLRSIALGQYRFFKLSSILFQGRVNIFFHPFPFF